jgi:hypothetical protein
MLAGAFVTLLQEEVGSAWSRTRLLEATNRGQNEILGVDCMLQRVMPDPFLATAASTFTYTAATSLYDASTGAQGSLVGDVRAVRDIYLDSSSLATIDALALDTNFFRAVKSESLPTERRIHVNFSSLDSRGAGLSDCTIKWPFLYNPGATTLTWRAVAYLWPTQLTSESIALQIPEDFQHTLLLLHVIKNIQRREFGREDAADYKSELSRFRVKYAKMASQGNGMTCNPRPC